MMGLHVHFLCQHVKENRIIWEGFNLPHSRCLCCNMAVLLAALNGRRPNTAQCAKGGGMEAAQASH